MNEKHNNKKELLILPLVLLAILVPVGGHWLMQPQLSDRDWLVYTLAALPFLLFGLVIWAYKIAVKNDQ
ncbi:hypothetical protein [Pseudoalteromonas tunicata]|jgi:hypothetical protein|uniref:Orphan protein n=1 Tax=Pseudoalteromonas tunicata D2 TaxID=87626 RepID=A4C3U8_9GAMM|nr:hypothetical protein [Pseudoalteromonas tunicata]ATC96491.1 hypothetical protein PTUN_b0015 [Pseudoalteromonas tunicata]AXT33365.1 hypothetical protein D1819_21460 [Pseudoalteromonas tunicata]EAR30230.1 hypothetical protein PTD2_01636 [Pseudoalteromonas tunicata D2]MDP4985623.1 hypothetical protein [Pseudoalteromonas tunicata]MDP5214463.1 hypothetical protein [Pseudoalteromonas tunicata]